MISKSRGDRAFYSCDGDYIPMPVIEAFRDAESFYATLAHESTHWTKHSSRLERDFGRRTWGDEGYAREELVAELGAAFLCADLDLTPEVRDDHASYIATLADGSQEREAGDFQRRRARTTCRRFPSRASEAHSRGCRLRAAFGQPPRERKVLPIVVAATAISGRVASPTRKRWHAGHDWPIHQAQKSNRLTALRNGSLNT